MYDRNILEVLSFYQLFFLYQIGCVAGVSGKEVSGCAGPAYINLVFSWLVSQYLVLINS